MYFSLSVFDHQFSLYDFSLLFLGHFPLFHTSGKYVFPFPFFLLFFFATPKVGATGAGTLIVDKFDPMAVDANVRIVVSLGLWLGTGVAVGASVLPGTGRSVIVEGIGVARQARGG